MFLLLYTYILYNVTLSFHIFVIPTKKNSCGRLLVSVTKLLLEAEHLSLYGGSVRATWREGSHTNDSDRHLFRALETEHFFL
jgi:hypothetical protein